MQTDDQKMNEQTVKETDNTVSSDILNTTTELSTVVLTDCSEEHFWMLERQYRITC